MRLTEYALFAFGSLFVIVDLLRPCLLPGDDGSTVGV
jgi:hypothetical protein